MKTLRLFFRMLMLLLSLGLAAYSANLRAEDIDIYVDNSASTEDLPNVLFLLDNSSNMGSKGLGCTSYAGTTEAPSLGTDTAGGMVQCALVDTINSLPDGVMRMGILSGNANNFATDVRNPADASFHETCQGSDGGCLLRKLTKVSSTDGSKTSLIKFIKSWKLENSGANADTTFPFTVTSAKADDMMQEAWAYYNGRTGLSGKSYAPSQLQGCQKNFIIYIGNTDKSPANGGGGVAALNSAGATTTQASKITQSVTFNPAICGAKKISTMPALNNTNDWSTNYADEWARLMFQQDGGLSNQEGMQNVSTYTVGIIDHNANQCTGDYPALLSSMADFGGGKAFRVSNASELKESLLTALNEVQAVNSVFSSASLPVSVNAEGSYLNQLFLGMFRPESSGAPRWMGNLKQYQIITNSNGQLVLGDSKGSPALSSGGTGFLSPNAVSFWTYKDTSITPSFPDNIGGFFSKAPLGTPPHGFDSADGEVVEKGGVAQQLRITNMTAAFTGDSNSTANPRRVYTYCPQGPNSTTLCAEALTDPTNDFSTTNPNIAAAAFGSGLTVPVTSIVRTGTSAVVTTRGNHGFGSGSVVTIKNANQSQYNVTQSVTVTGSNTFTISGLPDYPTTPSQGVYTVGFPSVATGSYTVASATRASTASTATTTTGGPATEVVTVTTGEDHPFVVNQSVKISNMTPSDYNKDGWVVTGIGTRTFTFNIPIYPTTPATSGFTVVHTPYSRSISGVSAVKSGGVTTWTVSTTAAHGFHVGQTVTVSGLGDTTYNRSWVVKTVPTPTTFTIDASAINPAPKSTSTTGSVTPSTAGQTPGSLVRTGSTVATYAVVSGMPANWFANGEKVSVSNSSVSANQSAYVVSDVAITCIATDCSSFSYPITASPALSATTSSGIVAASGGSETVNAGNITRPSGTPTIAKVTGVTPGKFTHGATLEILPSGTSLTTETAYVGTWKIDCTADSTCASFTFGPVPLTPASPATGNNIQAYSGNTSPDKNSLITWLRGQDNAGDEDGPGSPATVRPSVHGDVLHSRPLVINYGDSRGIVVFYGSNDGVYRAVNGNQKTAITGSVPSGTTTTSVSIPAGGELWGLILPDHYQLINRYRSNSPELKFPSSLLASAQPKDYFVDGPTGSYQTLKADGTIDKAYIYLTMRRGGRFMYAMDVTQPLAPKVMWSISYVTPGFEELGQTWSRPRFTLLQNYVNGSDTSAAGHLPVLVFGAGYDPSEDAEPPTADSMGRGIFIVNALTGALVWSASPSCDASLYPCKKVDAMKYATPSDITFVDRDLNGYTDKLYWGDLGGNLWRADVADASTANWKATRIATLGCDTGECASGTTPRKFFFPPAVLPIRISGASNSYEALSIVSGDREHPLRSTASTSSYNVNDRFFMIKDLGTVVGAPATAASTTDVTASDTDLFNATFSLWDGSKKGFYVKLLGNPTTGDKGEKGVSAPTIAGGMVFFATNRPANKSNTCAANLGEARAYSVNPFTGAGATTVLQGGGMPPSAVTGVVNITETVNGVTTTKQERFCIGCGVRNAATGSTQTIGGERSTSPAGSGSDAGGGTDCASGIGVCTPTAGVPKNLKRTYWYKQ